MYRRPVYFTIHSRLKEPRKFLQVLTGPRQTGKTTLIRQVTDELDIPYHCRISNIEYRTSNIESKEAEGKVSGCMMQGSSIKLGTDELERATNCEARKRRNQNVTA